MSDSHNGRVGLATLSVVLELERALAALNPPAHLAAQVAVARMYAVAIVDPDTLATFGPRLTLVMTRLDTALRRTHAADGAGDQPAARTSDDPPDLAAQLQAMDDLSERRRRRDAG